MYSTLLKNKSSIVRIVQIAILVKSILPSILHLVLLQILAEWWQCPSGFSWKRCAVGCNHSVRMKHFCKVNNISYSEIHSEVNKR